MMRRLREPDRLSIPAEFHVCSGLHPQSTAWSGKVDQPVATVRAVITSNPLLSPEATHYLCTQCAEDRIPGIMARAKVRLGDNVSVSIDYNGPFPLTRGK